MDSIWTKTVATPQFPSLESNIKTDVLIIGGGMAGILADLVQERENVYAEVFDPSRSMLKPQLLVNVAESGMNLVMPVKRRCPHLGCGLKWNKAEHSWDCPCHGSSIAFPAISTGVYGYPMKEAAEIALTTIKEWMQENEDYELQVILSCFSQQTYDCYQRVL